MVILVAHATQPCVAFSGVRGKTKFTTAAVIRNMNEVICWQVSRVIYALFKMEDREYTAYELRIVCPLTKSRKKQEE
jgi:hypothetical protein